MQAGQRGSHLPCRRTSSRPNRIAAQQTSRVRSHEDSMPLCRTWGFLRARPQHMHKREGKHTLQAVSNTNIGSAARAALSGLLALRKRRAASRSASIQLNISSHSCTQPADVRQCSMNQLDRLLARGQQQAGCQVLSKATRSSSSSSSSSACTGSTQSSRQCGPLLQVCKVFTCRTGWLMEG